MSTEFQRLRDNGLSDDEAWRKINPPAKAKISKIPYPRNKYQAVRVAMNDSQQLVCAVRDEDPNDVWVEMGSWSLERLAACCVVLAAMVPDTKSIGELAGWVLD